MALEFSLLDTFWFITCHLREGTFLETPVYGLGSVEGLYQQQRWRVPYQDFGSWEDPTFV